MVPLKELHSRILWNIRKGDYRQASAIVGLLRKRQAELELQIRGLRMTLVDLEENHGRR